MTRLRVCLTLLALPAGVAVSACGKGDDGVGESDPTSTSTDAGSGTGSTSSTGTTTTGTETSGTNDDAGDAETSATTTSESSSSADTGTTGDSCSPEVAPTLGDRAEQPCCTSEDSCAGDGVEGAPAASDVGDVLACVDGTWSSVAPEDSWCEPECQERGTDVHASGCVWRTQNGLPVRIACTCSQG